MQKERDRGQAPNLAEEGLKPEDRDQLVALLLKCNIMQNQETRSRLVERLLADAEIPVRDGQDAHHWAEEIVRACADRPGGLEALADALHYFDKKTYQYIAVRNFLLEHGIDCPMDDAAAIFEQSSANSGDSDQSPVERAPSLSPEPRECPYPGNLPITDSQQFCGREREIENLVHSVCNRELTVLIGPSGSGKSSLAFAALPSRLPENWPIRQVQNASDGFISLCTALGINSKAAESAAEGDIIQPLVDDAITRLLADRSADARLVLVIDYNDAGLLPSQWHSCQTILQALAQNAKCRPVLIIRSDYYSELMASPLRNLVQDRLVEIDPLTNADLRQMIIGPAMQRGVNVEPDLVSHLIADLMSEPGTLPLLQEVLCDLWHKRDKVDKVMSLRDYCYAGYDREHKNLLETLLCERAKEAFRLLPSNFHDLAKRIFLCLVEFDHCRPHKRRLQRKCDLADLAQPADMVYKVVQHFVKHRVLVVSGVRIKSSSKRESEREREPACQIQVELSHRALIWVWPTLRDAVSKQAVDEATRSRLEEKVRSGDSLDEVELRETEDWLKRENSQILGASAKLRQLMRASRSAVTRRRACRHALVLALSILCLLSSVIALDMRQQRDDIQRQRDRVVKAVRDSRADVMVIFSTATMLKPIAGTAKVRRVLLEMADRSLKHLLAADPDGIWMKHWRAINLVEQGDLSKTHDLASARKHYRVARDLMQEVVANGAEQLYQQRDLAITHDRLGEVENAMGNRQAARAHYDVALQLRSRLAATYSDNGVLQSELAISYAKSGEMAFADGDLLRARGRYDAALMTMKSLTKSAPKDVEWQSQLAALYARMGDIDMETGDEVDVARAQRHYLAALSIIDRRLSADSGSLEWQRKRAVLQSKLGDVAIQRQRAAQGQIYYESAVEISERLLSINSARTDWQRDLAVWYTKLGDIAMLESAFSLALQRYRRAFELSLNLVAKGDANSVRSQHSLAVAHTKLGESEAALGNSATARENYRQALALLNQLWKQQPQNLDWQRELSVLHSKLGDLERAHHQISAAHEHYHAAMKILRMLGNLQVEHGDWNRARHYYRDDLKLAKILLQAAPDDVTWQGRVIEGEIKMAFLEKKAGRPDMAKIHLQAADMLLQRFDSAEKADDEIWQAYREMLAELARNPSLQ